MNDVTEINPAEVNHDGGIAVGGEQSQAHHEDSSQTEPMSEANQAAVVELGNLRKQASDPALDRDARDALMKKMSELSLHIFTGTKAPAWYGDKQANPKDTSVERYDGLDEMFAKVNQPLTTAEHEQLIREGIAQGVDRMTATLAADFAQKAGLDNVTATVIAKRAAKHDVDGWGIGELTQEQHVELAQECVRRFGSNEKAIEQIDLANVYLEHMNLLDWVEKHAGSLAYDPQIISMLAYKARVLGLTAKK